MTRRKRRLKGKDADGENLSDVAAWLYTDLLLGLAVVFIGGGAVATTISRQEVKGDSSSITEVTQAPTYQLSCESRKVIIPQTIRPVKLSEIVDSELQTFAAEKQWSEIKPALVNVFGRDPEQRKAQDDARLFTESIISEVPVLRNAEIASYASTGTTDLDSVTLQIYVVYRGQEKDNGCNNTTETPSQ